MTTPALTPGRSAQDAAEDLCRHVERLHQAGARGEAERIVDDLWDASAENPDGEGADDLARIATVVTGCWRSLQQPRPVDVPIEAAS